MIQAEWPGIKVEERFRVPQVSFLETWVLRLSFLGFSSVACLLLKSGTRATHVTQDEVRRYGTSW